MNTKTQDNPSQALVNKLSYLAGIIDGEGTIGIYHNRKSGEYQARFYIVNTDKRLIDWIVENFGGSVYSRINPKHKNWKRKYEWCLTGKRIDKIIEGLIPFLLIKKDKAKIVLQLRKSITKIGWPKLSKKTSLLRDNLFKEIRKLNN